MALIISGATCDAKPKIALGASKASMKEESTGEVLFMNWLSTVPPQAAAAARLKTKTLDAAFDDDDETTDVGGSETESSSGLSGAECGGVARHCRFGTTPLETIPATPVGTAGKPSFGSPPGLSRAAMRQARDACKVDASDVEVESSSDSSAVELEDGLEVATSISGAKCRFGSTSLETVPATPPQLAKLKTLAQAEFGTYSSPPGLSRASMRQARDAVNSQKMPAETSSTYMPPALRSAKKRDAREALLARAKQGAALLKDEAEAQRKTSVQKTLFIDELVEDVSEAGQGSSEDSSSERSAGKLSRCRFGGSALETVPTTPAAGTSFGSPPGLSRAAMRQARDACMQTGAVLPAAPAADRLTISPSGQPLTPPSMRSPKRRSFRDALLARARQEGPPAWSTAAPR